MAFVRTLTGAKVTLAPFLPQDVGVHYVGWLNDAETMQFTESRFRRHTEEDARDYVAKANAANNAWLWRIMLNGLHVGNIRLSAPELVHKRGSIGIVIGDKDLRGKGIAPDAIALVTDFAFGDLAFNKLTAGMYADHVASQRAFQKVGFTKEALLRRHYLSGDTFVDAVLMARFAAGVALHQ